MKIPAPLSHLALVCALFVLTSCGDGSSPGAEGELTWKNFSIEKLDSLGYDRALVKIPADNPWTAAKADLGRHLFFDRRLSKDQTISCASCHSPERSWADRTPVSSGLNGQRGRRNTPSLVNRVFSREQFWDGRAGSLEEQSESPMVSPLEMGESHQAIVAKVSQVAAYRKLFASAYGDEKVDLERITRAIASFERTIIVYESPWQLYEAGYREALGEAARRGFEIFRDNKRGRCTACHSGPNLTDEKYHNTGIGMAEDSTVVDPGRYEATGADEDRGRFKTPTLLNVGLTAPYMHDGSLGTLEEVVEFYDRGGVENPRWPLDPEMKKLNLSPRDKKDLVEFLEMLTGRTTRVDIPAPLE